MASSVTSENLNQYCEQTAQQAASAAEQLRTLSTQAKNEWLLACADAIVDACEPILSANEHDIAAAPDYGLTDASIDRLRLDANRLSAIADALREIAALPDPVGEIIEGSVRPNGLALRKVRVPLGSVFFIYESRPNVTVDAAAICLKSGNAVVLRGGKEARHSSRALVDVMTQVARSLGIPEHAIQLVETTDRAAVGHFLRLPQYIDVAIPRGGKGLIQRVADEAQMPVIKHYDGNCHVYVDADADLKMAVQIVVNSKCQRMGVCNACESLIIHEDILRSHLPSIASALETAGVELRGDDAVRSVVTTALPAAQGDWSEEYLGPIISIKSVPDIDSAIAHINKFGSHHTDAIVTESIRAAERFCGSVDSSAVIVNASTRFNDGGEFGLGAEIGISTDKFHARGPCGLRELTTYKYIVQGQGQIRE